MRSRKLARDSLCERDVIKKKKKKRKRGKSRARLRGNITIITGNRFLVNSAKLLAESPLGLRRA